MARDFSPYLNNQKESRPCRAHFVSVKNGLCASTSYPRSKGEGSGGLIDFRDEKLCGMGILETNSFWVYRHLLVIPDRTMNDAVCECKEPKTPNEEVSTHQFLIWAVYAPRLLYALRFTCSIPVIQYNFTDLYLEFGVYHIYIPYMRLHTYDFVGGFGMLPMFLCVHIRA